MASTLSWTPVRRGLVYCSPACGGGCTFKAYKQAERKAKAMCRNLGPGWKPRVQESLGWYYAAENGEGCLVTPHGKNRYWASIYVVNQYTFIASSPRRAFEGVVKQAQATLNQSIQALTALKKRTGFSTHPTKIIRKP